MSTLLTLQVYIGKFLSLLQAIKFAVENKEEIRIEIPVATSEETLVEMHVEMHVETYVEITLKTMWMQLSKQSQNRC